jgi:hypothetical protein
MVRYRLRVLLVTSVLGLAVPGNAAPHAADTLREAFKDPPASARPRLWWHWMNGNISKGGIAKDIDWMSRIGMGGLQTFDAALATPQIVDHRLAYMTPEWKDAFRSAVTRADQKGLEMGIAASAGWSETGGPWVTPQDGMKKLVWSATEIEGGHPVTTPLPAPPSQTGSFQDAPFVPYLIASRPAQPIPDYYADSAVIAYRMPDQPIAVRPTVSDGDGHPVDAAALFDGSYRTAVEVPRRTDGAPPSLTLTYPEPQTIRSASVAAEGAGRVYKGGDVAPELLASQDGTHWASVGQLPLMNGVPTTIAFASVTARYFRFVFHAQEPENPRAAYSRKPGAIVPADNGTTPPTIPVREIRLSPDAQVDRFEAKAGFEIVEDYYGLDKALPDEGAVKPSDVVNLTDRMKPDGRLDWTPPPGRWRILRMGYSLTGTLNHPATSEATGLEVDKYDGAAVRRYLEHYIANFANTLGPDQIGKRGLRAIVTDSIETGPANWTRDLIPQFRRLRGYDPTPWLPVLTGAVIGSRAQSDAFLYDFRRTLADLLATQHYGTIADVAHTHDLTLYGEALEVSRPVLGDDIAMRRYADVPMSAMWTYAKDPRPTLLADVKGAASVSHLYGQNLVAAESMTAAYSYWAFAPVDLKPVIDLEFATGINRPVIHSSVHQPTDDKLPGLSLSVFGQYFNRHDTWAEMARPWIDYISRSSLMLQQGRYGADVAYFFGEEAPLTALYDQHPVADAPTHYGYDFVDADAIRDQLTVDQGDLVSKSGARYRLLYLGGTSRRMTLSTLRRLHDLVLQGATIVGQRPDNSPSLADDPAAFGTLADSMWSGGAITHVGKGRVLASQDVEQALHAIGDGADFSAAPGSDGGDLLFLHRVLTGGDLYFVSNRRAAARHVELRFRVTGKAPQLWYADDGRIEPVSYRSDGADTIVPLDLAANEAVFVVFRDRAQAPERTISRPTESVVTTLSGGWDVSFQSDRGAPAGTHLAALHPLDESNDPGIRYFSGVATYRKTVDLPRGASTRNLSIDLGRIGDVAEVLVNGQSAGIAWKPPYRVPIGAWLKPGANAIEVRVADLWVNRLIGDAQPGTKPITYTTIPTYRADAPLRLSGLMGPVTLVRMSP